MGLCRRVHWFKAGVLRLDQGVPACVQNLSMKTIYLAGPDVFFPNAKMHFEALEARCAMLGLKGVRPSDGGMSQLLEPARRGSGEVVTGDDLAERIYRANVALIRDCDGLLANLIPFRNALEPDSGTVFELGMAVALGKPVAAFVPGGGRTYEARVMEHCRARRDSEGLAWDAAFGFLIEEFGQPTNLMLSRSTAVFDSVDAALLHLQSALN